MQWWHLRKSLHEYASLLNEALSHGSVMLDKVHQMDSQTHEEEEAIGQTQNDRERACASKVRLTAEFITTRLVHSQAVQ